MDRNNKGVIGSRVLLAPGRYWFQGVIGSRVLLVPEVFSLTSVTLDVLGGDKFDPAVRSYSIIQKMLTVLILHNVHIYFQNSCHTLCRL